MFAKPLLVFSSYSLLFALLAIRIECWPLRAGLASLAVLGVVLLAVLLALDSTSSPVERQIVAISEPGPEAGGYLVSYLLPFVIPSQPSMTDLLSYGLFLIVAGIITASTGAVQVNPLLYLIRRRVVRVTDANGFSSYVVVRGRPIPGDTIWVTLLQPDVAVMQKPRRSVP
jgi:hypothetical protein